jgi:hypothetical protein
VSKQKAKPKSPRKPRPVREPRYEILAEGNPPRPVKSRSTDEDPFAPRNSPPKTGPKTKEGKDHSSQNALKHGLCQDIRHFKVLPGEDQSVYEHTLTRLLLELEPWDSTSEYLIKTINQARWHLDRSEFNLQAEIERQDGDFINPSLKFERYRASIWRRLTQAHKQLNELNAARKKEETTTAAAAAKVPRYGPDGKPYEVDRKYLICKFSNNPSPRHYIHNYATEKIILSNDDYWYARTIPLVELMEGEFFQPKYGLGDHFTEAFKEWAKTNKLYHPGEPYVTKKWPPPVPENCPPDDSFLDRELSLAEDPIAILKQRAAREQMEEERLRQEQKEEWARLKEEALQQEAEDQRRDLEEELLQAQKRREEREAEEEAEEKPLEQDPAPEPDP